MFTTTQLTLNVYISALTVCIYYYFYLVYTIHTSYTLRIHAEYSLNSYCCAHALMLKLHGTKPFWMRIKKRKQSFTRQLSFSQGEAYYYVILGKMSLFDGNNFLFIEMTVSSETSDRSFKFSFVFKINFIKMHAIDETWTTHYTVGIHFKLLCFFIHILCAKLKSAWLIGVLNRYLHLDMRFICSEDQRLFIKWI